MNETTTSDPRAELGEMLQGLSDEEVVQGVAQLDLNDLITQIFDAMVERFQPDRALGQRAVIQWEIIAAQGTEVIQLKIDDGVCTWARGTPETPRVTMNVGISEFLRFVAGQLDGVQAFMTGKLRLSGDLMFAQSIQSWFV